jgi:hypothetical protein
VRDGPADRSTVAHLRVAHLRGGIGEEVAALAQEIARGEVMVTCERADGHSVSLLANVAQVADPADVHQERGPGEADAHGG